MDESRTCTHWEKVSVLGVKIDALSLIQLLSEIQSCILNKNALVISYVNIHALNIAYSTPWFRKFLNESHLAYCDGVGLKFAAWLTGQHIRHRFTPPDFMEHICKAAVQFGWKIYFLGAEPGVAQRAADKLMDRFPGLRIRTHHGYFDR